MKNIPN